MKTEIGWDEWMALVRRIGKLEGAIEAHAILTKGHRRSEDEILYGLAGEADDE